MVSRSSAVAAMTAVAVMAVAMVASIVHFRSLTIANDEDNAAQEKEEKEHDENESDPVELSSAFIVCSTSCRFSGWGDGTSVGTLVSV